MAWQSREYTVLIGNQGALDTVEQKYISSEETEK